MYNGLAVPCFTNHSVRTPPNMIDISVVDGLGRLWGSVGGSRGR